jgi:hypothetical protein
VGVENMPDNVSEYVAAVHAWSSCVDAAVHDFASTRPVAGQGFDPLGECPGRPNPSEFNLGNAYGRPEQTGKPDDPGSQRYEAPGRPDDPGK